MNIAVVILNYNGLDNTLECVESVNNSNLREKIQIIVVDNNSQDNSQNVLKKVKNITLIVNSANLGYSGGNNIGIKYALQTKADYICLLNNDTKVDRHLIINLLDSDNHSIISPKIYFYPGFEFHENRYKKSDLGKIIWSAGGLIDWDNVIGKHRGVDEVDHGQYDKEIEIDYATGACIFAKRDIFENVGFLDEKYFLYLEDMDFSIRAKKLGYKIVYKPKAILWHKNAASAGGSGSKLQDYYFTRNRLLFAFKYTKTRTKLAVLRQIISQSQDSTKRMALLDFFLNRFGENSHKIT